MLRHDAPTIHWRSLLRSRATTKKNEKEGILAAYLETLDDATLERAVVFFAGSPFPRRDERVTEKYTDL